MLVSLGLAGLALRAGLAMRRARRRGTPRPASLLRSHLRMAKPAVPLLLLGFVFGPVSAALLRGWQPFGTLHAWLGLAAAALFAATGWLGRSLQRGGRRGADRSVAAERHGLLGTLALLLGALAAAAGMVLLP